MDETDIQVLGTLTWPRNTNYAANINMAASGQRPAEVEEQGVPLPNGCLAPFQSSDAWTGPRAHMECPANSQCPEREHQDRRRKGSTMPWSGCATIVGFHVSCDESGHTKSPFLCLARVKMTTLAQFRRKIALGSAQGCLGIYSGFA